MSVSTLTKLASGKAMTERFIDEGDPIYSLILDPVDVRCPECDRRATLLPLNDLRSSRIVERRLTCGSCGFTRDHDGIAVAFFDDGRDPSFGFPLWYRKRTSKGVLWAYHRAHLEMLRAYVGTTERERAKSPTWRNQSYFSRLPAWIKSARNRDMVVKALDQLLAGG